MFKKICRWIQSKFRKPCESKTIYITLLTDCVDGEVSTTILNSFTSVKEAQKSILYELDEQQREGLLSEEGLLEGSKVIIDENGNVDASLDADNYLNILYEPVILFEKFPR